MLNKNKNAFTLIEILLVISIIGLLASIVYVNVNSVRGKAQEKGVLRFSQSIYHALGANIIGEWKFEDNYNDSSNNGNNGQLSGGTPSWPAGILGKSLQVPNWSYVRIVNNTKLNSDNGSITIEAWIKRNNFDSFFNIARKYISSSDSSFYLYSTYTSPNYSIYFIIYRSVGSCSYSKATPSPLLKINEWNHIVGTYNKDNGKVRLYVNGAEITPLKDCSDNAGVRASSANLELGNSISRNTAPTAIGFIDEIRIYDALLSSAEIQKHYAEGLPRHLTENF